MHLYNRKRNECVHLWKATLSDGWFVSVRKVAVNNGGVTQRSIGRPIPCDGLLDGFMTMISKWIKG